MENVQISPGDCIKIDGQIGHVVLDTGLAPDLEDLLFIHVLKLLVVDAGEHLLVHAHSAIGQVLLEHLPSLVRQTTVILVPEQGIIHATAGLVRLISRGDLTG